MVVDNVRLKHIADYIYRGDAPTYVEEAGIPVINQACVSPHGLDLSKVKYHDPADQTRISSWIHKGDILLNSTGTGTLGRVAFIDEEPSTPMFVDSHVTLLRDSHKRYYPKFLFYTLSIQQDVLTALCSEGSTNQIELSRSRLGNLVFEFPSLPAQRTIAAFLDRETAKIDVLLNAKQRLLTLLAEKRQALITHVVTRGLNPSAPLKDSGVAWLGAVPEQWKIQRAMWLFRERNERSKTGEEVLLSLRMERGLVPHNDVSEKQTQAEDLIGYKKVSANEIVLNRMRAASGLVAVSPQEGLVSPDYAVFQALPKANPYYFAFLFRTGLLQMVFRSESTGLGTGSSGFLRLYSDSFLALWLPCPPLQEQEAILLFLEYHLRSIDDLTVSTKSTIQLLQERRATLISEAVTGQITIVE